MSHMQQIDIVLISQVTIKPLKQLSHTAFLFLLICFVNQHPHLVRTRSSPKIPTKPLNTSSDSCHDETHTPPVKHGASGKRPDKQTQASSSAKTTLSEHAGQLVRLTNL